MFQAWLFNKKRETPPNGDGGDTQPSPPDAKGTPRLGEGGPLDLVGQRSESVRDRVNGLAERLSELHTLSSDFGEIVRPLNSFLEQHAASLSKLMEVEALLVREREVSQASRAELDGLHLSNAKMAGDLQDAFASVRDQEQTIRLQDTQLIELRIKVDDLKDKSESLDDRLFAESERSKVLQQENAALRSEVTSAEDARAQSERLHAEARERVGLSEAECARLKLLTESMTHRLSNASRMLSDLEPQLQAARGAAAEMQGKLASEQMARQKSEAARESERAAHEVEVSNLSLKVDGLNAQVMNTDKLLAHLRDQLHDRSEALRSAEKSLKDLVTEKTALDRRLEATIEAAARANIQVLEAQRVGAELKDRADMLAKAVAAKDQALDGANRKTAGLLDRIEQLNTRFQQERSEFETTHRRTIEELQSERAERSMAQGALDIARKSRATLMTRYTVLKRQTSTHGSRAGEDDEPVPPEAAKADVSNVMAFNPTD